MNSLLFYLLQVIVVSGILYAYYHIALRNKKFHQYNRFYILAASLASILIPFLNIPVYFTNDDSSAAWLLQNLSGQPVIISMEEEIVEKTFNWQSLLYVLYTLIGLFGLARVLFSIRKLKQLMREHPAEHLNGIRFINTAEPGTPFSFFRWLFWNNKIELDSEKGEQIFRHEVFHIQQKHSLDIIFMEIITIVFWVNPLFHLMKKELKAIHEFLADRFASNETKKWEYAEMLLMQALNTQHQLVHPFFHNQIKRRIAMITNPHKTSHQYLRKLLVLPLAALLVTLFAFSYREKQSGDLLKIEELPLTEQATPSYVDTTPAESQLVGDIKADIIAINGKGYSKENQNIPPSLIIFNGKEYTRKEFSKMTGDKKQDAVIEAKYLVSTPANDAKAIAQYGEKARDGVLEFKAATIDTTGPKKSPVIISLKTATPEKEPLVILDGVKQENKPLKSILIKIDPNEIKSITVLKDSSAISMYGEKGANGVLLITTKEKIVGSLTPKLEEVTVVGYGTKHVQGIQLAKTTEERNISNRQVPDRTDHELREVTVVGYPSRKADSIRSVKITGQVTGIQLSPSAKAENQKLEAVTVNAVNNLAIVYPNPASNTVSLKLNVDQGGDVIIRILDMSGKEKSRTRATLIKGANTTSVSTRDLTPGTYIIRVDGQEQNLHTSVKLLKE